MSTINARRDLRVSSSTRAHARRWALPATGLALVALAAGAATSVRSPLVLWNGTPSEPEGLYVLTRDAPAPGRLIAFQAPGAAFPYADRRLAYLHHVPILKEVAAIAGDRVCTDGGWLTINGRRRGGVLSADTGGRPLPRWIGCRAMRAGEIFAFSGRVRNSFDSRYYGPVPRSRVVGVFRPLLLRHAAAEGTGA